MNIFKQEPYPCYPEDWDNPENTVFREFYLKSSPDFAILQRLVAEHMLGKGDEGITRHRLMHILRDCENRAFTFMHKKGNTPTPGTCAGNGVASDYSCTGVSRHAISGIRWNCVTSLKM